MPRQPVRRVRRREWSPPEVAAARWACGATAKRRNLHISPGILPITASRRFVAGRGSHSTSIEAAWEGVTPFLGRPNRGAEISLGGTRGVTIIQESKAQNVERRN